MKNSRFLVFVLVVSMMLMGAGYAAWTQAFEVDIMVDSGELDLSVNFCFPVTNSPYTTMGPNLALSDQYTVVVDMDNMYPGAFGEFGIDVWNSGTLGIKYDGLAVPDMIDLDGDGSMDCELELLSLQFGGVIEPGNYDHLIFRVTMLDSGNTTQLTSGTLIVPVNYIQFNQ